MVWWKKNNPDPIDLRSKALRSQLSRLEDEINRLQSQVDRPEATPKPRTVGSPQISAPVHPISSLPKEPIFEPVDRLQNKSEVQSLPAHYNDLGVRKYDPFSAWRRLKTFFRGPASTNPKLVTYLAAGSINGLRPLRYEKRVARNRFILLSIFFVIILWGILTMIFKQS